MVKIPHYQDGTEARVGDVVRGKGYNIKDEDGNLKEIVGTLVHVTPGASACNVQVANIEIKKLVFVAGENGHADWNTIGALGQAGVRLTGTGIPGEYTWPTVHIEYGQADHFEKLL